MFLRNTRKKCRKKGRMIYHVVGKVVSVYRRFTSKFCPRVKSLFSDQVKFPTPFHSQALRKMVFFFFFFLNRMWYSIILKKYLCFHVYLSNFRARVLAPLPFSDDDADTAGNGGDQGRGSVCMKRQKGGREKGRNREQEKNKEIADGD